MALSSRLASLLRRGFPVLVFLFLGAPAAGQQEPDGPVSIDRVGRGSLLFRTDRPGVYLPAPALETDVLIRVTGVLERTRVSQRFVNGTGACVEGIYMFPLHEGAAVDALRMKIGDRVIEGEIREREEAKKVYEQAKSEGRKASLVEQERPNVFTASVASIGPDEQIEIAIEYQETLRLDDGRFHLRFPLVVAPRYIPGGTVVGGRPGFGWAANTDRVGDAERVTPPVSPPSRGAINPVRIRVSLSPGFPLARLASASHAITTTAGEESLYGVGLAEETVPADRDFELSWEPEKGRESRASVLTERANGETYALVMLLPPEAQASSAYRLPRETVFIIDTSGSMHGPSIEGAKAALTMALDRLDARDLFNVIEFNSATRKLFAESRRATSSELDEARRWVQRLTARGGTEMLPALEAALSGPEDGSRVRQILFMTDGEVGNEEELFEFIRRRLGASRLFTVGMGSAPNSHFMTRAAEFGRGTFTYIASPSEVGEKMAGLFRKLEAPVLTNLEVQWEDPTAEAWPARLPDLYAGEPLVVAARLHTPVGGVVVRGERAGELWAQRLVLAGSAAGAGIEKLWARRKISALADALTAAAAADKDAARREVVAVALAHHLVSSFTSLVAVDVTPSVARGTVCEARALPVNLPAGWSHEHVFGEIPQTGTPARLYLLIALACVLAAAGIRLARGGGPS